MKRIETHTEPKIFSPEEPLPEHREALVRILDAYNDKYFPDPAQNLALLVKDPDDDRIIGGLWGVSYWRWLFIDQFVVPESYRGQGLGKKLLLQAEETARQRGCRGVWLFTFSFQAPEFYQKMGYVQFGRINDYPPEQNCTYFRKFL